MTPSPRGGEVRGRRRLGLPRRSLVAGGVLGLVCLAGLAYGVLWWRYWLTHVSTDDAYVTGHVAPVSARIAGHVVAVLVRDNQDVRAGDVLLRLDARDYEVARAQAQAAVDSARADLENATLSVPLTDETTRSLVTQADAAVAATAQGIAIATHDLDERRSELAAKQAATGAATAAVRGAEADFERARLDRDRLVDLFRSGLVARQDLDHAEAAFKNAAAALDASRDKLAQARGEARQAEATVQSQGATLAQAGRRLEEARALLTNAQSQRRQVKLREAQVAAARGRLAQALAGLAQAELNLAYTTVRAPIDGRVTRKTVEVGQVVQPAQQLLALVDLADVWIVANYKETELTEVRPGQRATVTVDTYPGVVFKARVDSIQGGSGSVFSLLPPENASGNFVKVVQRVPVKLVFEPGENSRHLLVPGMSVIPTIDTR
jgi:membrane fusion protein (multidrug efflux system)